MKINRLKVSGDLAFNYSFGDTNILLGTNESGKTTFVNLMLYALGARINSFIDEISKYEFCDYVYLDITTKLNNKYRIVRKLPNVDSVTVIPYNEDGKLENENVQILNLDEYSDFLLEEEEYPKVSITYSAMRSASLTYRFLIRTALVDQFTAPTKILASIQGDKNDFMNNQEMLNTAIIEQVLNTLDQDLQRLRLEYKQKEKERSEINGKITFYKDIRNELGINESLNFKKVDKVDDELGKLEKENAELTTFKYEQLKKLETVNDKESLDSISALRKKINVLKSNTAHIRFEIDDLQSMLPPFVKELENIKQQLISQKVLLNIPVTICPACFAKLENVEEHGFCSRCSDTSPQQVLDGVASYKRTIEETIKEIKGLIDEKSLEEKRLKAELSKISSKLSKDESAYINKLDEIRKPLENIISEIQHRIQSLAEREYQLREIRRIMVQQNLLKARKDELTRKLEEIREDIADAEKQSSQDAMKLIKFEATYKDIFETICGVSHEVYIHKDNYMPIIDDSELSPSSNHSASIKVVARLAYILTLYLLNSYLEKSKINNMQFVIFDSPREKDLDIDKYKRFLEIVKKQNEGQVFLTGSYREESVFNEVFPRNEGFYIDFLTDDSKLLKKPQEENSNE